MRDFFVTECKRNKCFSFIFSSVALLAYQFIHMMNEGDGVRERKREEERKREGRKIECQREGVCVCARERERGKIK